MRERYSTIVRNATLQLLGQDYTVPEILGKDGQPGELHRQLRKMLRKELEEERKKKFEIEIKKKIANDPKRYPDIEIALEEEVEKALDKEVDETLAHYKLPDEDRVYHWKKKLEAALTQSAKESGVAGPEDTVKLKRTKKRAAKTPEKLAMPPLEGNIPEVPSLWNLMERNIPEKTALELLKRWDIAHHDGDHRQMKKLRKVMGLFAEDPAISLQDAIDLAEFEIKAETYDLDLAFEVVAVARRYRTWRGNENKKAAQEVLRHRGLMKGAK